MIKRSVGSKSIIGCLFKHWAGRAIVDVAVGSLNETARAVERCAQGRGWD